LVRCCHRDANLLILGACFFAAQLVFVLRAGRVEQVCVLPEFLVSNPAGFPDLFPAVSSTGRNWERDGIVPDFYVAGDWADFTAETDTQLETAVQLLMDRD